MSWGLWDKPSPHGSGEDFPIDISHVYGYFETRRKILRGHLIIPGICVLGLKIFIEFLARKCEKEEKAEKLKVKKAIEKGNMDGARIYAENSIRKHNEQLNYMRLASRLDAVVSRLDTQAKMMTINKSMTSIVRALDTALASNNLQKMSETMDQFESQFVNMEVQSQFIENAMAGSTSLSTPEDQVNTLMQQVADDYGLEGLICPFWGIGIRFIEFGLHLFRP
ncbi:hypothetical protein SUGI_0212960 [Cryptomeria japonica]|nr:hypothetical protein SUGI_0212960 [Cryptomeria japonica]